MRYVNARTVAIVAASLFVASSQAQDAAQLRKDLTAVIALQGLPCGEVVSVKTQGDRDYIASCKDGNRYRVFVNAEGRVIAQKQ
jgi:hypothetical protein